MKIRKASKKDMKSIGQLIKTEFNKPPFSDGWTDKAIKRTMNNFSKIATSFVAIVDRKIVGAIIIRDDPYAKGVYVVIEELVVDSNFQKKGVGKALVKAAENYAKKKDAYVIFLYTHRNAEAVKFYKKLKFKESKKMTAFGKRLK